MAVEVLHLKTASSLLDEETVLSTRALAETGIFAGYRVIEVPEGEVPAAWPKVVPNSRGPQILVYHRTRDFMRRVSAHVSVGAAYKVEKAMGAFFTLIREDAS